MHGIAALLLNHSVKQRLAGEIQMTSLEMGPTGESSTDYNAVGDNNASMTLVGGNRISVDKPMNDGQQEIKGVFKEAKE